MNPTNLYQGITDLTGHQFGLLQVMRAAENTELSVSDLINSSTKWMCRCKCGKVIVVPRNSLISGNTTSCGCERYNKDSSGFLSASFGDKRIRNIWYSMKERCYKTHHRNYNRYGGRGITICTEWLEDFTVFRDWAKKNGYADNLTIDRIDSDGNYCPDNCRWITNLEQQSNKENNIQTDNGLSLRAECIKRGLNYNTIRMRMADGDYTVNEALNSKLSNKFYYGGKTMEEWCSKLDIGCSKVKTRMCRKKENFRDALLYYARMADNKRVIDFIYNTIPVDKDSDHQYYKPRSEEYRMKRKERLEKNKLFKGESV